MQDGNTTNNGAMGELDKVWFIHDNMAKYQDYCTKHGHNIGFTFPDGSRITAHDADDYTVF